MPLDPNKWEPLDVPPIRPGSPAMIPPPPTSDKNPYLRTTIPANQQLQPDLVKQQYTSAIPQIRVMPLQPSANAGVNAAAHTIAKAVATSVATTIAQQTVAPTDVDTISALNRQLFGSVDAVNQSTLNVGNGNGPSINSISTSVVVSGSNELVLVTGGGNAGASLLDAGNSPGAGWTFLLSGTYLNVLGAGAISVTQTLPHTSYVASQLVAVFKTNGSAPVFTLHGSGSGGTNLTSSTFTPTAGNSLLFISNSDLGGPLSVSDNQGNVWINLGNPSTSQTTGGFTQAISNHVFYAQNVVSASTTITMTFTGGASAGTWAVYEVSNIGNASSGSYTFLSSDNTKLVQFTGGANVTATLPSPALASGWQALVSNSNTGITTLTPASGVLLNNSSVSLPLLPGTATWVFSNGTNYFTTLTMTAPQGMAKVGNQWLDSYSAVTGTFTQSQPAFSNLSGLIASNQFSNTLQLPGVISGLNGLTLIGQGVPVEVGTVDTDNTANVAQTTIFTVPNASQYSGLYRITYYLSVDRVATTSSTLPDIQFTATDPNSSTVQTFGPFTATAPTGNTLTTTYSGVVGIAAKQNTAITYQTGVTTAYASVGATSMRYVIHIKVEAAL